MFKIQEYHFECHPAFLNLLTFCIDLFIFLLNCVLLMFSKEKKLIKFQHKVCIFSEFIG